MKKNSPFLFFYLILFLFSCVQGKEIDEKESVKGWIPSYVLNGDSSTWITKNKDALITTPEAAAIVAKAAVISIYNEECAEKEQPYKIGSNEDSWFVHGTLQNEDCAGGTFWLSIRKKDGKIERYSHEK